MFEKRVECGGESIHRSELAREKLKYAAGHLAPRVIVDDFREQARSYKGIQVLFGDLVDVLVEQLTVAPIGHRMQ